jgi:hypothetical protein
MNETFNQISGCIYSTLETQQHSFDMGKYVTENNIQGDIIECGIAAGGNFATMILGANSSQKSEKTFWGFDSFQGIQLAGKKDTVQAGIGAITHDVNVSDESLLVSSGITVHPKQNVINNLTNWGLIQTNNIRLIEGWIQNTLPLVVDEIKEISILRLDMDIYHPTKITLEFLYPKISKGGVVIIDDWELDGARLAVEEYLQENNIEVEILSIPNSTPKYFYKP